jgi:hypothetical protein
MERASAMTWYTKNVKPQVTVTIGGEGSNVSTLWGYVAIAAVAIPVGYLLETSSNRTVAERKKRWYAEQRAGEIAYLNKFTTRAR